MRFKIIILLCMFSLITCKVDRGVKGDEELFFKVKLRIKASNSDYFEVFYIDDLSENSFNFKKSIRKKFKGGQELQNIEFEIPTSGLPPNKFRLDLGQNKLQEEIFIDQIVVTYKSDSIVIAKNFIQTFFVFNKYLELKNNDGIFNIKEIGGRIDPFLISKPILNKKIEIEL